ncbi:uncharacterized protein LOC129916270, partial [Episyrphus balteatus]|uniref:uncharacterized protein LOC129916270 n=1 Tax=Episyrphus balteatus TaxID=286459 RepID=UPI002486C8E0
LKSKTGGRYNVATRCVPEVSITSPSGNKNVEQNINKFCTNYPTGSLLEETTGPLEVPISCSSTTPTSTFSQSGSTQINTPTPTTPTARTPSTTTSLNTISDTPTVVATSIDYSHNSTTTRSWPVIYRNHQNYDYEALFAINNNNNINNFNDSIIYASSEDIAQENCFYFQSNKRPLTLDTGNNVAETIRRGSILLCNSSGKIMPTITQQHVESPTSVTSAIDIGGNGTCDGSCCNGPPPILFLFVTLLMTTSATAMLCAAIMTDHWEHVRWDRERLDRLSNHTGLTLDWVLDEKVAILPPKDPRNKRDAVFLVPMHGGIWTLCIDLPLQEMHLLKRHRKFPKTAVPCVNYLAGSMDSARSEETRNDWQHTEFQTSLQPHLRMQNLSISCSLVCLIILGSAALVGAFGVCQRQISAILITGVMYLLAGGNQRDLARAKNMKKKEELTRGKRTDNLTVEQRKQRDADLIREKQRKKEEEEAARKVPAAK